MTENSEYKLYQWDSKCFRNYAYGDIISIGRNINEARKNAIIEYEKMAIENKGCWGYAEDSKEMFIEDISAEPVKIGIAAFIYGSD